MSINRMLLLGSAQRPCPICGEPQYPRPGTDMTAHEEACLNRNLQEVLKASRLDLAKRIKTHLVLKDSSPGFHLSDDDLALISDSLERANDRR